MNGWQRLWVVFSGALGLLIIMVALESPLNEAGCKQQSISSEELAEFQKRFALEAKKPETEEKKPDPSKIIWDDEPPKIDESKIIWDSAPKDQKPAIRDLPEKAGIIPKQGEPRASEKAPVIEANPFDQFDPKKTNDTSPPRVDGVKGKDFSAELFGTSDNVDSKTQLKCPSTLDYSFHYGTFIAFWLAAIGFIYLAGASLAWVRRGFNQGKK